MNKPINRTPYAHKPQATKQFKDRIAGFRAAKEAAAAKSSGAAYFTAEDKARMEQDIAMLWLHAAATSEGKFGLRWELTMSEGEEPDGEQMILTLACNGYRDELFSSLDLAHGPVGPLQLTKQVMRSGQEAWDLVEHPGF